MILSFLMNSNNLKKLLLPLLIVGFLAAVAFSVKYAFTSYENLRLQNKNLTLQIAKLENDLKTVKDINEENIRQIENITLSCNNDIQHVTQLYEANKVILTKELNLLKSKRQKEKAFLNTTKTLDNGTTVQLTDEEIVQGLSEIRVDSIFESFCSNNETELCKE